MNLIIFFEDEYFANELAERLSALFSGMHIQVYEKNHLFNPKDFQEQVLLTDSFQLALEPYLKDRCLFFEKNRLPEELRCLFEEKQILSYFSKVSEIYYKVLFVYKKSRGEFFFQKENLPMNIIGFYSSYGGSGTTAIATTVARILAGKKEGKVLLICLDERVIEERMGLEIYIKDNDQVHLPSDELIYFIQNKIPICLFDYLRRDVYGFFGINLKAKLEVLLEYLETHEDFETVIIDFGTSCLKIYCNYLFFIVNEKDQRAGYNTKIEPTKVLWNRCSLPKDGEALDYLMEDKESFQREEEKINIRLDGTFARNLRTFCQQYQFFLPLECNKITYKEFKVND